MPQNYLVANWKMNLPPEGIETYFAAVNRRAAELSANAVTVVAPPYPFLAEAASLAESVAVGAQNVAEQQKGAFTGEVSAPMLLAAGARFAIVGHSERRTLYGESDSAAARKLAQAVDTGLIPILCIGEELKVRDRSQVAEFLGAQIEAVAAAVAEAETLIVAYEPIWAIGTGRNAGGEMVAATVAIIREAMRRAWPAGLADDVPVLYGGSVTPDNIEELWDFGSIQGFLVGGASLDSGKFTTILAGMRAPS